MRTNFSPGLEFALVVTQASVKTIFMSPGMFPYLLFRLSAQKAGLLAEPAYDDVRYSHDVLALYFIPFMLIAFISLNRIRQIPTLLSADNTPTSRLPKRVVEIILRR